jgi:membrane-bound inhibitor of C-type lysozyme
VRPSAAGGLLISGSAPHQDAAMKRALAAIAFAAGPAGCSHHEEPVSPTGLLYACADGSAARIVYLGGGDPARARARLDYGGRSFDMAAAPAMSGLRYTSEAGLEPGRALVWSAQGDEAVLGEIAAEPAAPGGEREIVRCTRVRDGEAPPPSKHH